jgi:hypothetical protein
MTKRSIGGRHVAKERGLIPAWSGWPFGCEVRTATAVLRNPKAPRAARTNLDATKGPKPCQA